MASSLRRFFLPWLVTSGVVTALLVTPGLQPASAAAAPSCADFANPVLQRIRPAVGTALLTVWKTESDKAASSSGFTQNLGTAFRASATAKSGLVGVRRLYAAKTGDFLYTASAGEVKTLKASGRYVDQGIRFYVSTAKASCLVGVERFVKGSLHRMAAAGQGTSLTGAGWRSEGVKFYAATAAAPKPGSGLVTKPIATTTGTTFSFAAVPDTQHEVLSTKDARLTNRSNWLLKQPKMSFLLHTGDLVNWDTPDHAQFANAKRGFAPIEKAKLPYTISPGNHDTHATGVGGSAREPNRTYLQLRETASFNAYFDAADFRGVGGAFEAGKVDNVFTLYTAGGLKWMVLTLEFCPRTSAVAWAKKAIAAHPDYNVIISTHFYLSGSGSISSSDGGYGANSPKYIWEQLVKPHKNVKMVFSGHVGKARKARVDTGAKGNKVYSFLTTMHDRTSNPTRVVTVDTKARTLTTKVYAPDTKKTWKEYTQTIKGLTFVK